MRITAIALILLGCGVVYDFSPRSRFNRLPQLTSPSPILAPVVKKVVDTNAIIQSAARKHGVPPEFVRSIVAAESNFDPNAMSAKGAIGLMQLMPATAQEYGANPAIPEQNVDAGTQYLGVLLKRYQKYRNGMSRAIAAYNAGPGMVDHYRGIPPFRETRGYVARVLGYLRQYQRKLG